LKAANKAASLPSLLVSLKYPFVIFLIAVFFMAIILLVRKGLKSPLWSLCAFGGFVITFAISLMIFNSVNTGNAYYSVAAYGNNDTLLLNDSGTNVYGFFFRDEISYEGKVLIKKVVSNYLSDKVTEYFEELNQKGRVPEDSWLDSGYNKNSLQRVPSHTVHRLKYALKQSGGLTPSAVRDAIAKTLTETPRLREERRSQA
jgi:hypothetical protein